MDQFLRHHDTSSSDGEHAAVAKTKTEVKK